MEKAATRHLHIIKFNSWGLGALAIIFAALKDQVAGLEKFLGEPRSSEIGLVLFLFGSVLAILGVSVQWLESQQSERATAVLTDEGIRKLLLGLTDEFRPRAKHTISLYQIIELVRQRAGVYDYAAAQAAAEAIINRLLVRDLVSPLPGRSFSPKYKLSPELMDELVPPELR